MDPAFDGVFQGEFELGENKADIKQSTFTYANDNKEPVTNAVQEMMPNMCEVLRRQLNDFLPDGAYGGPEAATPELEHCPLTNLLGENVFGNFDYDIKMARNASIHARNSTNLVTHNKTAKWLQNKGEDESHALLCFARKKGKVLRQQHRQQEKAVMLRLRQKLVENKARKIAKEEKQAATKRDLLQRVQAMGGPCTTAEEVDDLMERFHDESKTAMANMLKDQIRFQTLILNQKGDLRLSGTVEQLKTILQRHLGNSVDDSDVVPPAPQRPRLDAEVQEENVVPFTFQRADQWVAVYYDNSFYIGKVTHVISSTKAMVNYMERKGDLFRWPLFADEAETEAVYVFSWDFEVAPHSSNMRLWRVDELPDITRLYNALKL